MKKVYFASRFAKNVVRRVLQYLCNTYRKNIDVSREAFCEHCKAIAYLQQKSQLPTLFLFYCLSTATLDVSRETLDLSRGFAVF